MTRRAATIAAVVIGLGAFEIKTWMTAALDGK